MKSLADLRQCESNSNLNPGVGVGAVDLVSTSDVEEDVAEHGGSSCKESSSNNSESELEPEKVGSDSDQEKELDGADSDADEDLNLNLNPESDDQHEIEDGIDTALSDHQEESEVSFTDPAAPSGANSGRDSQPVHPDRSESEEAAAAAAVPVPVPVAVPKRIARRAPVPQAPRQFASPLDILILIAPYPHCVITMNSNDHRFVSKWRNELKFDFWIGELSRPTFSRSFSAESEVSWKSALNAVHQRVWEKYDLVKPHLDIQMTPQKPGEVPQFVMDLLRPHISDLPARKEYIR